LGCNKVGGSSGNGHHIFFLSNWNKILEIQNPAYKREILTKRNDFVWGLTNLTSMYGSVKGRVEYAIPL